MSAGHEADVVPYIAVGDEWAVRCGVPGCHLFERYTTRADAEHRRDQHREETTGAP